MSVWALDFGTVCEMIFHCALFGFSWPDLAPPSVWPPANNFLYQSQLIMQAKRACVRVCVCLYLGCL